MSLVSKVGRRQWRARLAMALLYIVLGVGAVSTLYPFLMILSTGFKGPTDQNDQLLFPKYFANNSELEEKYLDDKYSGDASMILSSRIGSLATASELQNHRERLRNLPIDGWVAGFRLAPNQVTSRLTVLYQAWLRQKFGSVDALNRSYVEENLAFQTIQPPADLLERPSWKPPSTAKYRDYLVFKASLPTEFRIPLRIDRAWQEYQRVQTKNRFDDVSAEFRGPAESGFEQLRFDSVPADHPHLIAFQKSLPARYVTLLQPSAPLLIAASEREMVARNGGSLKQEFATRNFKYVLDYILINGSAVWNTVLFCGLAILTQLIVNPLAAYALSRYPIKASGKILVFLLATMAFPAEVAMIPSFLMLKELHLLNTLAALILPSAASGYMIFLLKGFFDSLPQELFEAGQLDGASEMTLLARVAVPLSKPVLGYLALMAFMGSYSTFMFAFLVIQDQTKWTLMVWVYQLQTNAPKSVTMAALALTALPTLVVFLCAQRVIMRGIVLPGER